MDIGFFHAVVIVFILGWMPVFCAFIGISVHNGRTFPEKTLCKNKLAKCFLWSAILFAPVQFLFMRYGIYFTEQARPSTLMFMSFAFSGSLLFLLFGIICFLKKKIGNAPSV